MQQPGARGKYAELLQGSIDAQEAISWSTATVIENREASADGSSRTLVISVTDAVVFADGRRVRHVQENTRWLDGYMYPGQFVAVRFIHKNHEEGNEDTGNGGSGRLEEETHAVARRLFAISSSPYDARSSSASLDATIVELLVSRDEGDVDEAALAALGPGAQFQVSSVLGNGWVSLFNSAVGLQSSMEEGRPLVMVAVGCRGMAPLRACLSWTPVLAHASAHSVSLFHVAESPSAAAYLVDWDGWRDAGVNVHPLYLSGNKKNDGSTNGTGNTCSARRGVEEVLEQALFQESHGLGGALGLILEGLPYC